MTRKNYDRVTLWAGVLALLLLLGAAVWGWRLGIFRDVTTLRAFIAGVGLWGPAALILLHVVQVAIPILPGAVALTAGVLAFGPWEGFLYNYIGIILGSLLAFLLARRCGKPLVRSVLSPALCEKYLDKPLPHKFERIFALIILVPFAPDDALCMVAGLSKIPTGRFVAIVALMKPITIFLYSAALLLGRELI